MNFSKMYTVWYTEAFHKAIELAGQGIRCKLYKESGVWIVQPN